MSEYTPSTKNIRDCYVYSHEGYDGELSTSERILDKKFDRWLNLIKAEAWDEGAAAVDTQYEHIFNGHPVPEGEMCDVCEALGKNPYRLVAELEGGK